MQLNCSKILSQSVLYKCNITLFFQTLLYIRSDIRIFVHHFQLRRQRSTRLRQTFWHISTFELIFTDPSSIFVGICAPSSWMIVMWKCCVEMFQDPKIKSPAIELTNTLTGAGYLKADLARIKFHTKKITNKLYIS